MKCLQFYFDTRTIMQISSDLCTVCNVMGFFIFQTVLTKQIDCSNHLADRTSWRTNAYIITLRGIDVICNEGIYNNCLVILDYTCRSTVYWNSKISLLRSSTNWAELISGQNISSNFEPYEGKLRPQHKLLNIINCFITISTY